MTPWSAEPSVPRRRVCRRASQRALRRRGADRPSPDRTPCRRRVLTAALAAASMTAGSPAAARADATLEGPWTLATAVERALTTHPSLAAAVAEVARARADLATEGAARRPDAYLAASAFRYEEPTIVTPIHGFTPGEIPEFDTGLLQGGAHLRYLLWDGGGRSARIDRGARRLAAAEAGSRGEEQRLAALTVSTYVRALILADTVAAHELRLSALEAERARVELLLAVGRAAEVDLRRVQATVAAARAEQVALAVSLDGAERDLGRLLDVDVSAARAARLRPVPAQSAEVTWAPVREQLLARALAANPAVARAGEELAAAEAAVAATRAARRPTLRLEGNLLGFASVDVDPTEEWNAGVRLAVPLFDGALGGRVARDEAARDGAAQSLALVRREVEAQVDRALATLAESVARAGSLEEAVARFAEVVRVERLRLENGVGIEGDYLDAEADLLAARAAATEARYGIVAARAELARVEGALTVSWLEELSNDEPGSETR